jgi:hypothetical protein
MKRLRCRNRKTQEYYNPFENLSFWLHLATIDFGFHENHKQAESVSKKKPLHIKKETKKL